MRKTRAGVGERGGRTRRGILTGEGPGEVGGGGHGIDPPPEAALPGIRPVAVGAGGVVEGGGLGVVCVGAGGGGVGEGAAGLVAGAVGGVPGEPRLGRGLGLGHLGGVRGGHVGRRLVCV